MKLVYYSCYSRIEEAIAYEKKMKNWHREWKINLITRFNPNWEDLTDENKIVVLLVTLNFLSGY